ncbi:hypothetical protein ABPG73_003290 [Tetrahymena malaccensis]
MSEGCNILKRRSSSYTYSKKPDQSFDISRLSTAINSSQKGTSPRSLNKNFYDSSNYHFLTESNSFQSKNLNGLCENFNKQRKNFVTPKQLFTENNQYEMKGIVEKHNQDQVNWSITYTNLLKDKTNLKKNILIKSKLR